MMWYHLIMPPSKGLSKALHLRMTAEERAILDRVQASFDGVGVSASLNDVIRHLIRVAEIPIPATVDEARHAVMAHKAECADCRDSKKPRCPDGVYVRREYQRHLGLRDGRTYVLQPVGSQDGMTSSQAVSTN